MGTAGFANLSWRFRRLTARLTWPLVAALGLAAFDVAFHFSTIVPALAQRDGLRAEFTRLRREAEVHPVPAAEPRNPEADLAAFYGSLSREPAAPDLLHKLHLAAKAQNLVVDKGDYRPVPDPGGKFTRYQIVLPARGTYPDVRRFLAQAGRDVPGLALDGVTFQRQRIGDEFLEAQIKFTLFLGGAQ